MSSFVKISATSNTANTYLWQNRTTPSTLIIDSEGKYIVTAFNNCGRGMDSILMNLIVCNCCVSVPNILTPNNDNKMMRSAQSLMVFVIFQIISL